MDNKNLTTTVVADMEKAVDMDGFRQGCDCKCCDHGECSDCACDCHATGKCAYHSAMTDAETPACCLQTEVDLWEEVIELAGEFQGEALTKRLATSARLAKERLNASGARD